MRRYATWRPIPPAPRRHNPGRADVISGLGVFAGSSRAGDEPAASAIDARPCRRQRDGGGTVTPRHAAVLNGMPMRGAHAGQLAGVMIPYSWILR
jgi:hypothetical protein